MRYILDTHILLWWMDDSKQLSEKFRSVIADSQNTIFISAVSVWEIEIKKSLGKLSAPSINKKLINDCQFIELPITMEHVLILEELPNIHHDPFDRLLICQCIAEKAILVTEDKLIKQYSVSTL